MKKLTLLLFVILLTTSFTELHAQTNLKQSKFSISIQGGTFLPIGDLSDEYKTGGNAGLGLNYKVKSNLEIYAEGNYNFTGYKPPTYNGAPLYSYDGKHSIFDLGIGVRFIFGQSKFKMFAGGGVGMYVFNYPARTYTFSFIDPKTGNTIYSTFTVESYNNVFPGTHAGLGGIFNVAKNVDLYIRSDFRTVLEVSGEGLNSKMFFGVYAGAKYGF